MTTTEAPAAPSPTAASLAALEGESESLPLPSGLSPSRVSAFTSCPLQFRFANIDKLPEPPSVPTTKGTIVHRALELLHMRAAGTRSAEALADCLAQALEEYSTHPDYVDLELDDAAAARFAADCQKLCDKYLTMEDPDAVRAIGLEVRMEATVGSLSLRGIIDRLELDDDGELVVVDYKTGRAPSGNFEAKSLAGVHFYAFLCEQVLGKLPARIRLMYLSSGETIETVPTAQSARFITTRTGAVWKAIETACARDDFRPRRSKLCDYCSFQAFCPEFGGDPNAARLAGASS